MKKALITGISGQDGSLLAEFLLEKGYEVIAISNHELSSSDIKAKNYINILPSIKWKKIDLNDKLRLSSFLEKLGLDEVYHLGSQSFPSIGFSDNYQAFDANCAGTYNLLNGVYQSNPLTRFFYAGSSEIFGDNPKEFMNENDQFYPKTMYGISKLVGHELVRNYRDNLGKYALTGFLFNHESPRRGEEFVTKKITMSAVRIKLGLQKNLVLGSLDSKRDWSAAEDFIEGFYRALNYSKAQDYVFSSGTTHSIREFVELAFGCLNLKYQDYVQISEAYNRPSKYDLRGDSSRARMDLLWKPKISFEQIIERMIKADMDYFRSI